MSERKKVTKTTRHFAEVWADGVEFLKFVEDLESAAAKLANEFGEGDMTVSLTGGWSDYDGVTNHDSVQIELSIKTTRDETDKEFESRLAREEKKRIRLAEAKEKQRQRDMETLSRLSAEYGQNLIPTPTNP